MPFDGGGEGAEGAISEDAGGEGDKEKKYGIKIIGKQCPHTDYSEAHDAKSYYKLGSIRNKWIGVKVVEWNEPTPQGPNVHMHTWIDEGDSGHQSWKL